MAAEIASRLLMFFTDSTDEVKTLISATLETVRMPAETTASAKLNPASLA